MSSYVSLEPDFSTIVQEDVILPYRSQPYKKFYFSDPMLKGYEVTVIAHSIIKGKKLKGKDGEKLATVIVRSPRSILPEVNTHRVFGRNSASSRARSVEVTIGDVMLDPHIPLFTKNKRGMSGVFLSAEDRERAIEEWLVARDAAVNAELRLLMGDMLEKGVDYSKDYQKVIERYYSEVYKSETPDERAISVHKQDANRLIEPFMWHEAIITSSYWDNFFDLRTDLSAAQPAIVATALLIQEALKEVEPEETWLHLPFIAPELKPESFTSFDEIRELLMISATECAQISYRDKSSARVSTATAALGERLLAMKHFSPFEHIAIATETYLASKDKTLPRKKKHIRSNLDKRWVQLRKILMAKK